MIKTTLQIFIVTLLVLLAKQSFAQLEKITVETYYITDSVDATDTTGGPIEAGMVTYRVYADLLPGTVVTHLFGDADHPFEIKSTADFFNHSSDGQSFGKDFLKARYQENTVALDTWLTIGQTTKKQGAITHFGLPKNQDIDGSFIGGVNNDGGSEFIAEGLLNNQNLDIPLTIADGMDTLDYTPSDWFSSGILNFADGLDSTIFGSIQPDSIFSSQSFNLTCSGVQGVVADSNFVLLAQLTTKGELSFKMNITVTYEVEGVPTTISYVGTNITTAGDQVYNPFLEYPIVCGCMDPNFLEFDIAFACEDANACQTPIKYGCLDTLACNYDSTANYELPALCCYPGWCANRDIESVCPQLMGSSFDFSLYPNPTDAMIHLNVLSGIATTVSYKIINAHGNVIQTMSPTGTFDNYNEAIDVQHLNPGIYQMSVQTTLGIKNKLFVVL